MKPLQLLGLFVLFISSSPSLFSQATSLHVFQDWVSKDGLSGNPDILVKTKMKNGNIYTLTSTMNNFGNYDWLLTKYSSAGNLIWSSQ